MANISGLQNQVGGRSATGADPNVRYFDAVAGRYFDWYREDTQGGVSFRIRRQRVMELFDQPGGRVLDIGCGPGVFVEEVLARGCRYVGVDHSPQMIAECVKRFGSNPNTEFVATSGASTPLPDQSVDAVLCIGVLERMEDANPVLAEVARVLRVGGTLIVTHSNRRSPFFLWQDYVYRPVGGALRHLAESALRRNHTPSTARHILTSGSDVAAHVEQHGFVVTDVNYACYPLLMPPLDRVAPRLAARLTLRAEALRHGWLRELGSMVIVRARRR